jgi:hypothetical protein
MNACKQAIEVRFYASSLLASFLGHNLLWYISAAVDRQQGAYGTCTARVGERVRSMNPMGEAHVFFKA